jgi:hypothetical protein
MMSFIMNSSDALSGSCSSQTLDFDTCLCHGNENSIVETGGALNHSYDPYLQGNESDHTSPCSVRVGKDEAIPAINHSCM